MSPQDWKLAAAIEIAEMVGRDDYITGIRTIIDGLCPYQDGVGYVPVAFPSLQSIKTNAIAGESGAPKATDGIREMKRGVE